MFTDSITIEQAWAIGIFEGEGCISIHKPTARQRHRLVRLTVSSTDKDVIEIFHNIIGVGNIRFRPSRSSNLKPSYIWTTHSKDDMIYAIQFLMPGLCNRRSERAKEAIHILENEYPGWGKKLEPGDVCKNGHKISSNADLYFKRDGAVVCKLCSNASRMAHYYKYGN